MQTDYLERLSEEVQQFILEVEGKAGVDIKVIPDINLNNGGPNGEGNLAIIIKDRSIRLYAPTNGYFSNGAVRHEVLHVQRFHVDGVPMLAADSENWDKATSDRLVGLDNAIEHLIIVSIELQFHPERFLHWETLMKKVCLELPNIPKDDLSLAVCLHLTFLRHVLPSSPSTGYMINFAKDHELLEMASDFGDQFIAALDSKEELIRLLFLEFSGIARNCAALEYINSIKGTYQIPIP